MASDYQLRKSWRVRDVYDGTWWTVRIEKWTTSPSHRVRAVHDEIPGLVVESVSNVSYRKAVERAEALTLVLGGRRYQDEWILCESTRSIKGWIDAPWPGPCAPTWMR